MKQILLLLFFTGISICSRAQNYIYYFEGELDQESISLIEKELSLVIGVATSKIKEDSGYGEIIISLITRPERSEAETQFSPVDLKNILISHQLTPLQFIESK